MEKTLLILASVLSLAAPLTMHAQDYDYTNNPDGLSVTILSYKGPGGDVTIPSTINGLSVNNLGDYAFEEKDLTSVTIPNGVTNIGGWVFFSCTSLTNVSIPGSVISIGESAFNFCTTLDSITIPEGVTEMGEWEFSDCLKLSSVTMPSTLVSIPDGAFFECENLTDVTLPDGITSIGIQSFDNCTSLSSAVIPATVTSLGVEAFQSCTDLTNVVMAGGVTNIGEGAFNYCVELASVTLPDTVTSIGPEAFQTCVSLTRLAIPASVTNIGALAFGSCSSLGDIYFSGNAPEPGAFPFLYDTNAIAFYLPGTTGWKSAYAGIPTKLTPTYAIRVIAQPPLARAVVTGANAYSRRSSATVTASTTNDCYVFVNWTALGKIVSTNSQYTFAPKLNETLIAHFALLGYAISTSSSPANGGITVGGGKKNCGATVILRAVARPGFVFSNWTSSLGDTITNVSYTFSASENESFVAHFVDIKAPTVKITSPILNQKIGVSAFTIKGTASDNVGVTKVYYNLNDTGWQMASGSNNFATWFVNVNLTPSSANTISAVAMDAVGKTSTNGPIKFFCTAQP